MRGAELQIICKLFSLFLQIICFCKNNCLIFAVSNGERPCKTVTVKQ